MHLNIGESNPNGKSSSRSTVTELHRLLCRADGKRYQRSTGIRVDGTVTSRRKAQKIADEYEDVARRKRTAQQVQRVIGELWEEVGGRSSLRRASGSSVSAGCRERKRR